MNEFIRSVTDAGSNIRQGLLHTNEHKNRKLHCLLEDNFREVQAILNFNGLVYVGYVYHIHVQDKFLTPLSVII